jgi:protein-tyrosine kinase
MSRIQKIVERGKAERLKAGLDNLGNSIDESSATVIERSKLEYTTTKVVEVPKHYLVDNRLVAADEQDPRSVKFNILRTKILQQMRMKGWNSIGVTSPTVGAGKSLVAANLAISMATEGNQTVLLVDMDLRKPYLHKSFAVEPGYGIHDVLENGSPIEKTLINPGVPGLVLLPGRKGVVNSAIKLSSPTVKALVEEIRTRYESRIIIFDLPPVLVTDDVMVFLPYIDCTLVVVEAGHNKAKDLEDTFHALGTHPVLGTVLNKSEGEGGNLF